jgi:hypothetical protein
MLGLLKLVTIVAASLLVLDAVGRFDWMPYVHDPAVPLGVDLLMQGKRDVAALFARAPWFPAISENATQIEVGLAVVGGVLLMAANRLTVFAYIGNVLLSSIALGVLFLLAGPGRQVIASHPWQFGDQGGASFSRSASQAPGMIYGRSDMEPGQWTVRGYYNNERRDHARPSALAMLQLRKGARDDGDRRRIHRSRFDLPRGTRATWKHVLWFQPMRSGGKFGADRLGFARAPDGRRLFDARGQALARNPRRSQPHGAMLSVL